MIKQSIFWFANILMWVSWIFSNYETWIVFAVIQILWILNITYRYRYKIKM